MIECCGLEALNRVKEISNISAYTLVQMAKENDIRLFIFKVDRDKLALVHRPAIFHSMKPNHFAVIMEGEPLTDAEFSGYVLSEKPMGLPVSYTEAKKIMGGGPVGAILSVIAKVAIVTTQAVANVGSAIAGALATGAQAVGGAVGGVLGGSAVAGGTGTAGAITAAGGAAGGAAAAGAAGGAIGATGAAIGAGAGTAAGIGSGALGALAGGAIAGGTSAAIRAAGKEIGGAGAVGGIAGPVPGVGTTQAIGTGALQGAGVGGTFIPGAISGATGIAGGTPSAAGTSPTELPPFTATEPATKSSLIPGVLQGKIGKAVLEQGIGLLAGGIQEKFAPRPQATPTLEADFSRLRDIVGDTELPQATGRELLRVVDTPLKQLTEEFSFQNDRVFKQINDSFDRQVGDIRKQAANSGLSEQTSSDVRDRISDIEQRRAESLGFAEQDLRNQAFGNAVEAKQFALRSSLQQNQFDVSLAMDLAQQIGLEKQLQRSIQQDNFVDFQNIITQILSPIFQS